MTFSAQKSLVAIGQAIVLTGLFAFGVSGAATAQPQVAVAHAGAPDDARAIDDLLSTYQAAVSHKNEALFETLLLGKDIPFAFVPSAPVGGAGAAVWRDYDGFRKSVFEGPPFTQTFSDIHIRRHGALADVDLTYSNADSHGVFKAWKTMQLIRIAGRWKIASEFFTDAPSAAP